MKTLVQDSLTRRQDGAKTAEDDLKMAARSHRHKYRKAQRKAMNLVISLRRNARSERVETSQMNLICLSA